MDNILKLIPFVSNYPDWVKGIFAIWVLISAILLISLVLFHENTQIQPKFAAKPSSVTSDDTAIETELETIAESLTPDYSAISPDEVISTLTDKNLTALQITKFKEEYKGRLIQWEGVMLDIKPSYSKEWSNTMVFRLPSDDDISLSKLMTASFSQENSKELHRLKKGSKFVIQGNLSFSNGAFPSPSIENAKLIRY